MTYARNISTALKSHPAQLSCFASLPPTTGEEGGGNPCSCSRRSETDAPLMQAGPHAGMILRTQSMPIDMGNKFLIAEGTVLTSKMIFLITKKVVYYADS